jgi:hypothetical protein
MNFMVNRGAGVVPCWPKDIESFERLNDVGSIITKFRFKNEVLVKPLSIEDVEAVCDQLGHRLRVRFLRLKEELRKRKEAEKISELVAEEVSYRGRESLRAYLNNQSGIGKLHGPYLTPLEQVMLRLQPPE